MVDLAGDLDVRFGDPAGIMGDQGQGHPGIADPDVRVVIGLLGDLGHRVDEVNRLGESLELDGPDDFLPLQLPVREFLQRGLQFLSVKQVDHGSWELPPAREPRPARLASESPPPALKFPVSKPATRGYLHAMKLLAGLILCALAAACAPSTPEARIKADPNAFHALSPKHQDLVRQGRIENGMGPSAVRLAWGNPSREYEGADGQTPTRIWQYDGARPVYSTGIHSDFIYSPYYRFGRRHYLPYQAYSLSPQVDYVPYRRATVWFSRDRVTRWERAR